MQDQAPTSSEPARSAVEELLATEELRDRISIAADWARTNLLTIESAVRLGGVALAIFAAILFGRGLRGVISKRVTPRLPAGLPHRLAASASVIAGPIVAFITLHALAAVASGVGYAKGWIEAAISLLSAWIVIRLVTLVIRSPVWSRAVFFVAWPVAALDVLGLLGPILAYLDAASIPLGEQKLSLLTVVRAVLAFGILLWLAGLVSKFLERRIYQIEELTPSFQILIVQILRLVLPAIAFLFALSIVNIDLTVLAVFGGAVGIGVGLGLQRSVSNLIGGLMMIMDKSIKPGDVVAIGETFGWVTSLGARYVAIRTRDGTEHLVPNEHFIINGVENWSHEDRAVRIKIPIGISYGDDPHRAIELCESAAGEEARVLKDPKPLCHLKGFGDSALDLELRIWIGDPQNGVGNIKSAVLLRIWDAFKAEGVEIPFPQRDIHLKSGADNTALLQ